MKTGLQVLIGVLIVLVVILGVTLAMWPAEEGSQKATGHTVKVEKPERQGEITIGSILPLTGDAASIGQNTRHAIELAVSEINNAGGINGNNLKVLFEDGKCNAKDATNAANKLVHINNVPAIIGGLCSSETLAAAPIAENGKTVLFSPCSSSPDVTTAGDYVFRDMPSDSFQGKYAAEVTFNSLNGKDVAVLYCLSDWCVAIKQVFKQRLSELGGTVVMEEGYEQTARDLRTQLAKIKQSNPDVLYFLGYTEASIVGLKQTKELGFDIPIIGGDAWDDPKIWEDSKEAGEGVRYTMVSADLPESFKSKMRQKTGTDEITLCTPQAYDAVNLVAEVMEKAGTDSAEIKDELYKVGDYNGVSGTIAFDENGDLTTASFITKIVHNGKAEVEN